MKNTPSIDIEDQDGEVPQAGSPPSASTKQSRKQKRKAWNANRSNGSKDSTVSDTGSEESTAQPTTDAKQKGKRPAAKAGSLEDGEELNQRLAEQKAKTDKQAKKQEEEKTRLAAEKAKEEERRKQQEAEAKAAEKAKEDARKQQETKAAEQPKIAPGPRIRVLNASSATTDFSEHQEEDDEEHEEGAHDHSPQHNDDEPRAKETSHIHSQGHLDSKNSETKPKAAINIAFANILKKQASNTEWKTPAHLLGLRELIATASEQSSISAQINHWNRLFVQIMNNPLLGEEIKKTNSATGSGSAPATGLLEEASPAMRSPTLPIRATTPTQSQSELGHLYTHKHETWDRLIGLQKTHSWQTDCAAIRYLAISKIHDLIINLSTAEQVEILRGCLQYPLFCEHRSNYRITGAWGDTETKAAIKQALKLLGVKQPNIELSNMKDAKQSQTDLLTTEVDGEPEDEEKGSVRIHSMRAQVTEQGLIAKMKTIPSSDDAKQMSADLTDLGTQFQQLSATPAFKASKSHAELVKERDNLTKRVLAKVDRDAKQVTEEGFLKGIDSFLATLQQDTLFTYQEASTSRVASLLFKNTSASQLITDKRKEIAALIATKQKSAIAESPAHSSSSSSSSSADTTSTVGPQSTSRWSWPWSKSTSKKPGSAASQPPVDETHTAAL